MKSLNNYISGGFFNNVGAGENAKKEMLDEIIDWICDHDAASKSIRGTYESIRRYINVLVYVYAHVFILKIYLVLQRKILSSNLLRLETAEG